MLKRLNVRVGSLADLTLGALWDADLLAQRAALQEVLVTAQGTGLACTYRMEAVVLVEARSRGGALLLPRGTATSKVINLNECTTLLCTGEMALEVFLRQVREHWVGCELEMATYRSRTRLIKGWEVSTHELSMTRNVVTYISDGPNC